MELSLKKLFGGSRYLIQSIHAKKLQVRIFSRLGLQIQDNALTNSQHKATIRAQTATVSFSFSHVINMYVTDNSNGLTWLTWLHSSS